MELFVCSSAYQLLNAINIVNTYRIEADLILIRKEMETICDVDVLLKSNFFRKIYKWYDLAEKLSDQTNSSVEYFLDKLKKAHIYVNKKNIYKSLPNGKAKYDVINIAYADYPSQCIYYYFKLKGAKLAFFEDGTYTYNCLAVRISITRRVISKLLFGSFINDDVKKVYVRIPSKLNQGKRNKISVEPINSCKCDNKEILFSIFKGKKKDIDILNKRIVFFDQNIEYAEVKEKMIRLANDINIKYGKNNIVVKLHPASRNINDYSEQVNMVSSRLPFELIMEELPMNNKVLVSIFSTACFSPKFIMDEEPYIIFTYKALGFDKVGWFNDEYTRLIRELKDTYSDPKRVLVPKTYDDVIIFLDKIMKKECMI
ncbi:MAG: alpha-2,8-polysialyltransferase family protein [Ruminococcus sp.]|nr:alpha-2,8-polysialyltransferase family protein [Ruminococcus sp.]